jgi:hypothetical protein
MADTNFCDYDHRTTHEVRLLSTGGDNMIVCHRHYVLEMEYRRGKIADGVPFELPEWEKLKVYEGKGE